MQKHRTKRVGRGKGINANVRIDKSVAEYITNLLRELGDDEGPASVYLRQEYLSKFCSEDLVPASDRANNAINKWIKTEVRNAETNLRLSVIDRGYNILPRVTLSTFVGRARSIIRKVLGPLRDELVLGSFSGGASTSRRRTESLPAHKFTGKADVTLEARPYVDLIHNMAPLLRQHLIFYDLREVEGSVLFTVPKKSDIDRCACKEPDINMFLQKGVGSHIRRRLRKFGIDLNDQSVNREWAQAGSLCGDLATLDLSSASDTISYQCVKLLLPDDWFEYLDDIRSKYIWVNGTLHRTEMFSSMGNGFTFELESLIFWALMRTCAYFEGVRGVISVYGDDIIIPSGMYDMATWVLRFFGFTANLTKSFHTGPFRESCGGHYHNGHDITPFYLKRTPTHLTDVIRVANQLRRWAMADPGREFEVPATYNVWLKLASFIPRDLWGGCDLSLDTQLASPHPSSKRLVRFERKIKVPQVGAYVDWHNSHWNSGLRTEVGHEPLRTESKLCRKRAANSGALATDFLFYQELKS